MDTIILKYQEIIKNRLQEISLHWDKQKTLKDSINYSLLNYGKLSRGLLLLFGLDEVNIDSKKYIDIACAIEMIQTYTLIHDDLPIMDDAKTRRAKPTNHLVYGSGVAMLAGDALLSDAFYVIANSQIKDDLKIKIIKTLSYYIGSNGICYGQVRDLENESCPFSSIDDIYDVIINKTSKLFIAVFEIIGEISSLNKEQLYNLGLKLGLAFQIKDDLNDYMNTSVGKDNSIDVNKSTINKLIGYDNTINLFNNLKQEINEIACLLFKKQIIVIDYLNILLK